LCPGFSGFVCKKMGFFAKNRDFWLKRDFQRLWLIVY
jgi:hypothetical protein